MKECYVIEVQNITKSQGFFFKFEFMCSEKMRCWTFRQFPIQRCQRNHPGPSLSANWVVSTRSLVPKVVDSSCAENVLGFKIYSWPNLKLAKLTKLTKLGRGDDFGNPGLQLRFTTNQAKVETNQAKVANLRTPDQLGQTISDSPTCKNRNKNESQKQEHFRHSCDFWC